MGVHAMLGDSGKFTNGIKAPSFDGTQVCTKVDPELFFPDPTETQERLKQVKPLCDSCAFTEPCLEYALNHPELQGIWAGTTDKQRITIRRRMRRIA